MPAFTVKTYGDYPAYVEKTRVLLATINDHNISVNRVNGVTVGGVGQRKKTASE